MPRRQSDRQSSGSGGVTVTGLGAGMMPAGYVNHQQQLHPQQMVMQPPHQMVAPMMSPAAPMMQPVMTPARPAASGGTREVDPMADLFSDDDEGPSLSTDRSRSRQGRRGRASNRQSQRRRRDRDQGPRRGRQDRRGRRNRSRSNSNDSAAAIIDAGLSQQTLPSGYIPRNITFLRSVPKVLWFANNK